MKCKLEIVSGFLGSGKTSFINSYLTTEMCNNDEILVVLLERGTTNIEKKFKNVKIVYLNNCDNMEDLLIDEIKHKKYNRIIIEFNGTYDLSIIDKLLKNRKVKEQVTFYGNYFIGDSSNLEVYLKNMGELIIPFIQSSKIIVLNNLNSINKEKRERLMNIIEGINLTAPIICSLSINNLKEDLNKSSYFREGILTRGIRTLFNKEGK
ncbi:hypothetical protein NSA50_03560 [Clostridium sp. DSM 100503]|uniref:GTP-binding protein n=1 Tax=Clostridium sp. DSM 100503 TaxID=2963282 RepID=UPI002149E300|nr:GTP-binding protein [Clostridium sp. DSM 100503]MCR1950138.1 hypothetical protein [Clostridium sp. DSM 100503]